GKYNHANAWVKTTGQDPLTTIAFGSCDDQYRSAKMWKEINDQSPQLWIWGGDNIYGDSYSMDTLRYKYRLQLAQPGYQQLKKTAWVTGTYDDHDYGVNDGGKEYKFRQESRNILFDFLGFPKNDPDRFHEGAYNSQVYGPAGKQVKVINLDTRYFRDTLEREMYTLPNGQQESRYKRVGGRDILGEAQWKWLENELVKSKAKVNLLVSGSQFLPTEHAYEKWANFPKERERLLQLIASSGVQTPILLSGDRHIAEIMKLEDERFPMGLYEVTSSGMTHTWSGIAEEKNSLRVSELIAKLNYGLATIDWESKQVVMEIKGENGRVYAQQVIPMTAKRKK
ncbi:MAG: alkaline phosphatase family protein, partial [Cyclobacteriaceae bacterium]|nr:alkaline phosphatase family protein [Cyclobacteriaceae bacterium]